MTWTQRNGTFICLETEEELSIITIDHAEEPNTKFNYHVELYDVKNDYREYIYNSHKYELASKALEEFIKLNPHGSITLSTST
jgi:hypothetical protein